VGPGPSPGAATSITLVNWFPTMPAGSTKGTVFETDDLEGEIATLRSRGVSVPGGIEEAPWGRFVTLDDPDGNGIVLQQTATVTAPAMKAETKAETETA
jgi:hypothetical protein